MKRSKVTREALQAAIAEAVREADPDCEALLEVILECVLPTARDHANWALKGVRYGKAERAKCDVAISAIIEQLQKEFTIADESKR
jgi:hypothetical protein